MLQNLGGAHLLAIVFIVLLIFGAPKLPGLAKSLGQSMRILRKEVRSDAGETDATPAQAEAAPAAAPMTSAAAPASAPVAPPLPGQPDVR